jgi:hypothetical protein
MVDPTSPPTVPDDPAQRTLLSWQRTAMATAVVAGLVVRAGIVEGLLGLAVPAAVLLMLGAATEWLYSLRISSRSEPDLADTAASPERAALTVAAVTAVAACASLGLTFGS